jgi:hypothetical protein
MAHPRRRAIVDEIPAGYSPALHITLTVGSGLAVLILATFMIEDLSFLELLTVPAMWVLANLGEWFAHKYVLHRRVPGMTVLYEQHTPRHHVVYPHDSMAIEGRRELHLVLIPPFGVGMITLAVSPFALAFGALWSANAGWLVLVAVALYTVSYEITHLLYHLPEDHFITRSRTVRFLREHHRRHHDPRLMQRWNFNVTVPLWDVILGTRISDAAWAEHLGEARTHTEPERAVAST